MILSHVIELDDVAVLDVGVDSAGNHYLVFIDGASRAFHDIKEHGRDQLPLLCHYVVSDADFGDLAEGGVEATKEVDKALIIGDSLLLDVVELQLARAGRLLQEDLVGAVEEV